LWPFDILDSPALDCVWHNTHTLSPPTVFFGNTFPKPHRSATYPFWRMSSRPLLSVCARRATIDSMTPTCFFFFFFLHFLDDFDSRSSVPLLSLSGSLSLPLPRASSLPLCLFALSCERFHVFLAAPRYSSSIPLTLVREWLEEWGPS